MYSGNTIVLSIYFENHMIIIENFHRSMCANFYEEIFILVLEKPLIETGSDRAK